MPHNCTFAATRHQECENARVDAYSGIGATLAPDYLAVMLYGVKIPLWGYLKPGTIVEVVGSYVRLFNGQYVAHTLRIEGAMVNLLALTKPYAPLLGELVVSPATGNLVPAGSGTGKRVLGVSK